MLQCLCHDPNMPTVHQSRVLNLTASCDPVSMISKSSCSQELCMRLSEEGSEDKSSCLYQLTQVRGWNAHNLPSPCHRSSQQGSALRWTPTRLA